jgi:hypothetical protein
VLERLERAEIANARLNTMQEFWDHEQLRLAIAGATSALPPERCRR